MLALEAENSAGRADFSRSGSGGRSRGRSMLQRKALAEAGRADLFIAGCKEVQRLAAFLAEDHESAWCRCGAPMGWLSPALSARNAGVRVLFPFAGCRGIPLVSA